MRTLLLFRGAPGCGKSTYIKEHNLEQYVLSADTLRLMCQSAQETPDGQMEISPQNDDVVWEMLFKLLEVRMSHGEFTVIDATNSKTVEMNCYKNLAKQYRYRMYVIDMTDLPIEECKRRNAQREWLKRVPEAAIDKMYARFATQKVPSGVTVLPSTTDVMSDLNYCPNDFNQWKKIHIIGDIHGCYTCLSEYLGEMKDDELYIFVGDYLDRGIENVEVFKFLCDVVNNNRKNVILLEGNHEHWLNKWGHDKPVQSEEFANYTRPQLFKAGIDKNTARKIYSRVGQCVYFEYDGKRYFVSHGGLSYLPYFLPFVSADQMIKGVGRYPDILTVAESWEKSMPDSYIQIFGHRNVQDVPIDMGHRCYNLEGKIEFGGYLRCVELEHGQPIKCVETKNDVFRKEEPKTETAVEMKTEFDNAELVSKMRQSKYVFEKRFGDISSFNFSREAFYKKHWDEVSTKARGLFINTKTNKIVARSYDKFFAVDERNETRIGNLQNTLKFPVTAYLKENGFLGIISYDAEQDGLFIASKSTPDGPFADMFRKILMDTTSDEDRKNLKEVAKENGSIIFEVIDPVNDAHIIEYKKPHIVLLDIIANDMNFSVMDYDDLKRVAEKCHLQIKEKVKTFENWSEFYPWYEEVMNENYLHHGFEHVEGFVLRDSNNFMFKLKLPYYKHWKFLRGVMQSVQKRGYYENTAKLFTAEDNLFYGWMLEQREKDQESFCKKGIIQLRNEFYASQQKS